MNGKEAGLAHIYPDIAGDGDLEILDANDLINEMRTAPELLRAMVIGVEGLDEIVGYCQAEGIKVESVFHDDYFSERHIHCHPRDIVVVPSLREVFIYTHKGKVTKKFGE